MEAMTARSEGVDVAHRRKCAVAVEDVASGARDGGRHGHR